MVLHEAGRGLDWVMDKSLVLGYTKIGPAVRRDWWPHDPVPGALVGRHVLVTGASGGLGLATARGLARLGAAVHVTGRDASRLDDARSPAARGAARSPRSTTHVADVSDLAATAEFARAVRRRGAAPARRRAQRRRHAAEAHDDARGARADPRHARARPARADLRPARVARRRAGRPRDVGRGLRPAPRRRRPGVSRGRLLRGHGAMPGPSGCSSSSPAVGARPGRRRHHGRTRCTPAGPTPGRHGVAAPLRRGHRAAAAQRRLGRRHRRVAHRDRRPDRHRRLLARPPAALDALRARRGSRRRARSGASGPSCARPPECPRQGPDVDSLRVAARRALPTARRTGGTRAARFADAGPPARAARPRLAWQVSPAVRRCAAGPPKDWRRGARGAGAARGHPGRRPAGRTGRWLPSPPTWCPPRSSPGRAHRAAGRR